MTLLQFEVYLYNDEIIREGTIGRKMFFISRGTVRIVNAKTQTHTLTDGAFFGEISLILPNLRRVASVFADSYCYLYSLTNEDFNRGFLELTLFQKFCVSSECSNNEPEIANEVPV